MPGVKRKIKLVLSRKSPRDSARHLEQRLHSRLVRHDGRWLEFDGRCYRLRSDDAIKKQTAEFLETNWCERDGQRFEPKSRDVTEVVLALTSLVHIEPDGPPPFWLQGYRCDPQRLLIFRNGSLDVGTGTFLPPSPNLFALATLDFDYDPEPPKPQRWLTFLDEVIGDGETIAALQEVFGYLLTHDTSQQKVFYVIGPIRSGKSRIAEIATALVGTENACAPLMTRADYQFHFEQLLGKRLAVLSETSKSKASDRSAILEVLLRVSGEDRVTVTKKYAAPITVRLPTRFFFIDTAIPDFNDTSGALAARQYILTTRTSFLDREDPTLRAQLLTELPGIAAWALAGLRRLEARGRFPAPPPAAPAALSRGPSTATPPASQELATFLAEHCTLDAAALVMCRDLVGAWNAWRREKGLAAQSASQFGKLLSAHAGISKRRLANSSGGANRRPWAYVGVLLKAAAAL